MSGRRLLLATRNEHKLRELAEILEPVGVELEPLPEGIELPPETGETFADNALIKARAAHEATGAEVIADDSGIMASALGGRPGVRSARYAGPGASDEENLRKLIDELAGEEDRSLAYVCVIALIEEAGTELTFEGRCAGAFTPTPRGSGGFGYDPCFVPADTGFDDERTMAELSVAEKHSISHRGRAARELVRYLASGEGTPRPGEGKPPEGEGGR